MSEQNTPGQECEVRKALEELYQTLSQVDVWQKVGPSIAGDLWELCRAALSTPCGCEQTIAELREENERLCKWNGDVRERLAIQDSETGRLCGVVDSLRSQLAAAQEELRVERERNAVLVESLRKIERFRPDEFDYSEEEKETWSNAVKACPECIRYKGHPIQLGICDAHRRWLYRREEINKHRENNQDETMRKIARAAIDAARERKGAE